MDRQLLRFGTSQETAEILYTLNDLYLNRLTLLKHMILLHQAQFEILSRTSRRCT